MQEDEIGTRVYEGNKEGMRLADGDTAKPAEGIKRWVQQRKKFMTTFGIPAIVLNNHLPIMFCEPINIQPQEPIHQESLHHQVNIL